MLRFPVQHPSSELPLHPLISSLDNANYLQELSDLHYPPAIVRTTDTITICIYTNGL
jgi:hypothetical protein